MRVARGLRILANGFELVAVYVAWDSFGWRAGFLVMLLQFVANLHAAAAELRMEELRNERD
jgi:hypothetical protein